jgi:hypothetical protein
MRALNVPRSIVLALAALILANMSIPDEDRAPHLYPKDLPGTIGCLDDAYGRVTWGCD